jgi:hypothetical protein
VFYDYRTGTKKKEYRISSLICKECPIKKQCLGKTAQEKKFSVTYYREQYERNNRRVHSKRGSYMKAKRQSTVEPVFGTLIQFMSLRKINTIGIQQANKVMHLSAIAYNLKKYLKFITNTVKSDAKAMHHLFLSLKTMIRSQISIFKAFTFLIKP